MITREVLFRKTSLPAVGKSLDASMLRSKAIAQNIANAGTPGYNKIEVKFEDDLKKAIDKSKLRGTRTSGMHLDIGRRDIKKIKPKSYRPVDLTNASGENNVDIDMEAAKLAENQILFNYGVKFMSSRFTAIKSSITGRQQ